MSLNGIRLDRNPFSSTDNLSLRDPLPSRVQILQSIVKSIQQGNRVIAISGNRGMGRTFISETLVRHQRLKNRRFLFVDAEQHRTNLAQALCTQADIPFEENASTTELIAQLRIQLESGKSGKAPIVIIDGIEWLDPESIIQLGTLSRIHFKNKASLQIILTGCPDVLSVLQRSGNNILPDKIEATYTLPVVPEKELIEYLRNSITQVSEAPDEVITADAYTAIARLSRGAPGTACRIAEAACNLAVQSGIHQLTDTMVRQINPARLCPELPEFICPDGISIDPVDGVPIAEVIVPGRSYVGEPDIVSDETIDGYPVATEIDAPSMVNYDTEETAEASAAVNALLERVYQATAAVDRKIAELDQHFSTITDQSKAGVELAAKHLKRRIDEVKAHVIDAEEVCQRAEESRATLADDARIEYNTQVEKIQKSIDASLNEIRSRYEREIAQASDVLGHLEATTVNWESRFSGIEQSVQSLDTIREEVEARAQGVLSEIRQSLESDNRMGSPLPEELMQEILSQTSEQASRITQDTFGQMQEQITGILASIEAMKENAGMTGTGTPEVSDINSQECLDNLQARAMAILSKLSSESSQIEQSILAKMEEIQNTLEQAHQSVTEVSSTLEDQLKNRYSSISAELENQVVQAREQVAQTIANSSRVADKARDILEQAKRSIEEQHTSAISTIENDVQSILEKASEEADSLNKTLAQTLAKASTLIKSAEETHNSTEECRKQLSTWTRQIESEAAQVFANTKTSVEQACGELVESLDQSVTERVTHAKSSLEDVENRIENRKTELDKNLSDAVSLQEELLASIRSAMHEERDQIIELMADQFSSAQKKLDESLQTAMEKIAKADSVSQERFEKVHTTKEELEDSASQWMEQAQEAFDKKTQAALGTVEEQISRILAHATEESGRLQQTVQNDITAAHDQLNHATHNMEAFGRKIVSDMNARQNAVMEEVNNTLEKLHHASESATQSAVHLTQTVEQHAGTAEQFESQVTQISDTVVVNLREKIRREKASLEELLAQADKLSQKLDDAEQNSKEITEGSIDKIHQAAEAKQQSLLVAIDQHANEVNERISSIVSEMDARETSLQKALSHEVDNKIEAIRMEAMASAEGLAGQFDKTIRHAEEAAKRFEEAVQQTQANSEEVERNIAEITKSCQHAIETREALDTLATHLDQSGDALQKKISLLASGLEAGEGVHQRLSDLRGEVDDMVVGFENTANEKLELLQAIGQDSEKHVQHIAQACRDIMEQMKKRAEKVSTETLKSMNDTIEEEVIASLRVEVEKAVPETVAHIRSAVAAVRKELEAESADRVRKQLQSLEESAKQLLAEKTRQVEVTMDKCDSMADGIEARLGDMADTCKTRYREFSNCLESMTEEHKRGEKLAQSLQTTMQTFEQAGDRIESRLRGLTENAGNKLSELQDDIDHTLNELSSTQADISNAIDKKVHDVLGPEGVVQNRLSHVTSEIDAAIKTMKNRCNELVAIEKEVSENTKKSISEAEVTAREKLTAMENRYNEVLRVMDSLRQETGNCEKRITDAATSTEKSLEKLLIKVQAATRSAGDALKNLNTKIDGGSDLKNQMETLIGQSQKSVEDLEILLKNQKSQTQTAEERILVLEKTSEDGLDIINKAQKAITTLANRDSEIERRISQAQELMTEQDVRLENEMRQVSRLEEEIDKATGLIERMRSGRTNAEEARMELEQQYASVCELVNRIYGLWKKFDTFDAEVTRQDEAITNLVDRQDGLQTRFQKTQGALETLQIDINTVESKIATLLGDPQKVVIDAKSQAAELRDVCRVVKKVFGGLSKASLDANSKIQEMHRLEETATRFEHMVAALKDWVGQTAAVHNRLTSVLSGGSNDGNGHSTSEPANPAIESTPRPQATTAKQPMAKAPSTTVLSPERIDALIREARQHADNQKEKPGQNRVVKQDDSFEELKKLEIPNA